MKNRKQKFIPSGYRTATDLEAALIRSSKEGWFTVGVPDKPDTLKESWKEHTELAGHMQRMAATGSTGTTSEWGQFINAMQDWAYTLYADSKDNP